jgi:hypothetical protein
MDSATSFAPALPAEAGASRRMTQKLDFRKMKASNNATGYKSNDRSAIILR